MNILGDVGWVGASWGQKLNDSAGYAISGGLEVPITVNPDAGVQEIAF